MDEINAAKQQIISAIDSNGCAVPEDYSLSTNFSLNPEVSEKVLRNVIYENFFAANFSTHGKRIFERGDDSAT